MNQTVTVSIRDSFLIGLYLQPAKSYIALKKNPLFFFLLFSEFLAEVEM